MVTGNVDRDIFRTLIDSATVAAHTADPRYVIVDCRFRLDDPGWGETAYAEAHVPGAVYAHLDRDLSGQPTGTNGRHPLPSAEALQATLGRLGIDRTVQVVAYDQDTGIFASRLWCLLRWLGHDQVAVLDGGFAHWVATGHATASGPERRPPRHFVAMPRGDRLVDVDQVSASVARGDRRLLDARAPERFSGAVEPLDRAAGHIPGARNYHYMSSLDATRRFLPPDKLRTQIEAALGGVAADQTISYCGSGVTACHNLLAMEHAGLMGAKLYPGSWSEWSSEPTRPIEKGGGNEGQ